MIRTMNTFTSAVQGARKRIHAADLTALVRSFIAFALLTIPTFALAASWDVQAMPNEFYTLRLGSLIRGRTTSGDVEAVFGRPQNSERRSDGVVTYYAIQIYNQFEDLEGRR